MLPYIIAAYLLPLSVFSPFADFRFFAFRQAFRCVILPIRRSIAFYDTLRHYCAAAASPPHAAFAMPLRHSIFLMLHTPMLDDTPPCRFSCHAASCYDFFRRRFSSFMLRCLFFFDCRLLLMITAIFVFRHYAFDFAASSAAFAAIIFAADTPCYVDMPLFRFYAYAFSPLRHYAFDADIFTPMLMLSLLIIFHFFDAAF